MDVWLLPVSCLISPLCVLGERASSAAMWAPAQSEAEHGRLATFGQLCGLLPTHQHHPQPCSWRGETISNCIIKNEMKCTGDLEIIHEIVLDTTGKSEKHELIRVVSPIISCSISESPLHFFLIVHAQCACAKF